MEEARMAIAETLVTNRVDDAVNKVDDTVNKEADRVSRVDDKVMVVIDGRKNPFVCYLRISKHGRDRRSICDHRR